MWKRSKTFVLLPALLWAGLSLAADSGRQDLYLEHVPVEGEQVLLSITVGVLEKARELIVLDANGKLIGSVSPHGIDSSKAAGTYTLAVPARSLDHDRLKLQIIVDGFQGPRPPHAGEVLQLRTSIIPIPVQSPGTKSARTPER